jgi:hypothetical protein
MPASHSKHWQCDASLLSEATYNPEELTIVDKRICMITLVCPKKFERQQRNSIANRSIGVEHRHGA